MAFLFGIIIYSLLFSFIFSVWHEREKSIGGFFLFFSFIFLPLLALSIIVPPYGPVYGGVAWLDLFVMALLISLFIGAVTPPHYYQWRTTVVYQDKPQPERDEISLERAPSLFFWAFFALLIITLALLRLI